MFVIHCESTRREAEKRYCRWWWVTKSWKLVDGDVVLRMQQQPMMWQNGHLAANQRRERLAPNRAYADQQSVSMRKFQREPQPAHNMKWILHGEGPKSTTATLWNSGWQPERIKDLAARNCVLSCCLSLLLRWIDLCMRCVPGVSGIVAHLVKKLCTMYGDMSQTSGSPRV
jgi:hypothetical protein